MKKEKKEKKAAQKPKKEKKQEAEKEVFAADSAAEATVAERGKMEETDEAARDAAILADRQKKPERYFEAVGRRKTAVARVRLFTRAGDFLVNAKHYASYFSTKELQKIAEDALQKMKLFGRFKVTIKVSGGGVHAQAEAVRHGLARALTKFNPDFRKRLKRAGFLRRDPRAKERKKPGLKRARRAPQWHKR